MTARFFPWRMGILWFGFVLSSIMILIALLPIQPNDFWWYLRLGGDIVAHGKIPITNTYSLLHFGEPMVYHSWLSALIFWKLYTFGGITLIALLRVLVFAIFYVSVWYTARLAGAGERLSAILMLISALAGSVAWSVRPQLFSLPLFTIFFILLLQWRAGKNRWLWLLVPMMALWVNLHGAFVLGILLIGAAWIGGGGNRRVLGWLLAAVILATLFNPRGFGAWQYLWSLLTDPASQTFGIEWQPPNFAMWQGKIFYAWLLAMPLIIFRQRAFLNATDWFWFLGFGSMALSAYRYVIWFLVILVYFSAIFLKPSIGKWLDRKKPTGIPLLNATVMLIFLFAPIIFLPGIRGLWWQAAPPTLSNNTPVEATRWLENHPVLQGVLFSDVAFASYHVFALPQYQVWLDTRFELYSADEVKNYLAISHAQWNWETLLEAHNAQLMMLNFKTQPALIDAAKASPRWQMIYSDDVAIIFVRGDERSTYISD